MSRATRHQKLSRHAATMALLGLLMACSAHQDGYSRALRQSEGALKAAQAAQAGASPMAALHLQQAQEQMQEAARLNAAGHPHRAVNLLRRAEADAQLALALVQETVARAHTEEMTDRLEDLRAQE